MSIDEDDQVDDGPTYGIAFWIGALAGAAIIAFGIHGLWVNERRGFPSAAKWFVGGALVLDLVVVPVGAALGWVSKRLAPPWTWPVVRTMLLTSVVLIAFAAPLILDEGGVPSNPTVRPRNYGTGLIQALVVTWIVGGGVLVVLRARHRRRPSPALSSGDPVLP